MAPTTTKLFVYGSLRSGFHSETFNYMSLYFELAGPATVNGALYDLGDFPAAKPDATRHIVGELYTLKDPNAFSWVFGQLDDYEGVIAEEGETAFYTRELATANRNGNHEIAWIYWYNGDVSGKPVIESGDLLEYLKNKKNAS